MSSVRTIDKVELNGRTGEVTCKMRGHNQAGS